jgi:TRAP-type C4-dicarboxylate transport system substrate-binding protein
MEKLPDDLRALVTTAATNAVMEQRRLMEQEESVFKDKVIKAGMVLNVLTAEEKAPFVAATEQVYPLFAKDLTEEIMELIKQVQK